MVHRPTDSRLLTNLISQEKEYSKQLNALLAAADASVASLSAYAAASSPPASQTILKVAGSLASADDELRRYASSVEEWREQLKSLKTLEEEVSNIIRDREILVTRVIKASRQKQHHASYSNLSRTKQHPSTSSLSTNKSDFSGKAAIPGSSKLAHAQSELQACETHLASKERELAIRRSALVKAGLDARFRAMINCGWAWGEIGKEALRTLEELTALTDPQSNWQSLMPSRPSSDLSSIGPSQSASQVNVPPSILGILHSEAAGQPPRSESPSDSHRSDGVVITIPPAHSIPDIGMPVGVTVGSNTHLPSPPPSTGSHDSSSVLIQPQPQHAKNPQLSAEGETDHKPNGTEGGAYQRHVLPRRITEEELAERVHDSSTEDLHGEDSLTAVDNPRFVKKGSKKQKNDQSETPKSTKRERRGSLLGSIRGLFGHHSRNESSGNGDQQENRPTASSPSQAGLSGLFGKKSKWETRTDKNLRKMKNHSDDEDNSAVATLSSSSPPPGRTKGKKLRRMRAPNGDAAAESDTGAGEEVRRQARKESRVGLNRKRSASVPPASPAVAPGTTNTNQALSPIAGQSGTSTQPAIAFSPPGPTATAKKDEPLSRRSSVISTSSAPPVSGTKKQLLGAQVGRRASLSQRSMGHARSSSQPVSLDGRKGRDNVPYISVASLNGATTGASLMGIVEDVARANREAEARLRKKRSLSLVELLPGADSTLSLTSSTVTVKPGSLNPINRGTGVDAPPIFVPSAPHSVSRQALEALEREEELSRYRGDKERQVASPARAQSPEPALQTLAAQVTSPSPAPSPNSEKKNGKQSETRVAGLPTPDVSSPSKRPAQSPLRSALRNPTSRSVSPALYEAAAAMVLAGPSLVSAPTVAAVSKTENIGYSKDDDSASVSSYETGLEIFFDDADTRNNGDAQAGVFSPALGSVLSGTSTSVTGSGTPQRRKSVRVSLQPTFSPSPIDYDTDDDQDPRNVWDGKGENPAVANGTATGRIRRRRDVQDTDVWENSSDEDEEYANAKKLLTKLSATAGKKGW